MPDAIKNFLSSTKGMLTLLITGVMTVLLFQGKMTVDQWSMYVLGAHSIYSVTRVAEKFSGVAVPGDGSDQPSELQTLIEALPGLIPHVTDLLSKLIPQQHNHTSAPPAGTAVPSVPDLTLVPGSSTPAETKAAPSPASPGPIATVSPDPVA